MVRGFLTLRVRNDSMVGKRLWLRMVLGGIVSFLKATPTCFAVRQAEGVAAIVVIG